jgi:hypothetical protein
VAPRLDRLCAGLFHGLNFGFASERDLRAQRGPSGRHGLRRHGCSYCVVQCVLAAVLLDLWVGIRHCVGDGSFSRAVGTAGHGQVEVFGLQ